MIEEEQTLFDDLDFIHLVALFKSYLRVMKKTWLLPALFFVPILAGLYFYNGSQYQEAAYYAKIYYSVDYGTTLETTKEITSRIANGLDFIVSTADFKQDLCKELGVDQLQGSLQYTVETIESANLFNVTLISNNADEINPLMKAFEIVYPLWVTKSIGNAKLTILDEAENVGINSNEMSKKTMLVMAAGGSAVLWIGICTLLLILFQRIHNQRDMSRILDLECFGILKNSKKKRSKKAKKMGCKDPLLLSNEAVDFGYLQSIRTGADLIEQELQKQKQIFLLTSTAPKEGKSTVAANLGYALTQRGKKVLVIDADLYSGGLSNLLQISREMEGLSDFLCGEQKEKIHVCDVDHLLVVASGTRREEAMQHFNARSMSALLDRLKKQADVILIDCASAGIFGDAQMFLECVDEAVFVVRCEYASVKSIRDCILPFADTGKLGGYILNRAQEYDHDARGKFGYGYSRYRNGDVKQYKHGSYLKKQRAMGKKKSQTMMDIPEIAEEIWNL